MERSSRVAVLFAKARSIYRAIPGCDVYDVKRDALTFDLAAPVVAHPPCAPWSAWLAHMSKNGQSQKFLAPWAVDIVRRVGGVLEHPAHSRLWAHCGLPAPIPTSEFFGRRAAGELDTFGGFALALHQGAYGHAAPKWTWLYIVGVSPAELVNVREGGFRKKGRVEDFSKGKREATPLQFAKFLVRVARLARWSRPMAVAA